jgi:hypothetical protein
MGFVQGSALPWDGLSDQAGFPGAALSPVDVPMLVKVASDSRAWPTQASLVECAARFVQAIGDAGYPPRESAIDHRDRKDGAIEPYPIQT